MRSTLTLHGYLQAYYAWFEQNSGNDTFDIRRAFVTLDGKMSEDVSGRVQIDAAASSDVLRDAYIKYTHFPHVRIKVGQFKIPFSEDQLTSSGNLDTIQRALSSTKLSTDRDIGVMLEGEVLDKKIYYAGGIFNGTGRNISDTNENKDFIGRVLVSPFKGDENLLEGLSVGGSVQTGKQSLSGTSEGTRERYGALVKYAYKNLKLQSEYIFQQTEQTDNRNKYADGWYLMTLYKLNPKLQGVVKYEQYEPDRDVGKDRESILTLGANWNINKVTKIQANYRIKDEQTEETNNEFIFQAQVKY